jgi:hypothetical protein
MKSDSNIPEVFLDYVNLENIRNVKLIKIKKIPSLLQVRKFLKI